MRHENMKAILKIGFWIIILALFQSCSNDNDVSETGKKSYYVKYELSTKSIYIIKNVKIKVLTENGLNEMMVPTSWEGTFGPFNDSENLYFNVELTGAVDADSGMNPAYNNTTFTGRISISVNNSPFVLKSEVNATKGPLNMMYKVNIEDLQ